MKTFKRLLPFIIVCAMLTGCKANPVVTEEEGSVVDWSLEAEADTGAVETETKEDTEESVPEVELVEEPEQVPGEDYQLDIKVMALEIGADETSVSLVWEHTYTDGEYVRVWQATEPDNYLEYPATLNTSIDNKAKLYTANLFDLKPGTQYGYKIVHGEEESATRYFVTNESKTDFEFLAAGDPQIGTNDSYEDGEAWQKAIKTMLEATGETNFILSLGDAVDDKNSKYQYDLFMTPEELKSIPVASIVGNHDNDSPYYEQYFAMPNLDSAGRGANGSIGKASANYSFTYGDTLFLCLNSNNRNYDEHTAFMKDTIQAYTGENGARPRWIIAAMHHSIYSITDHLDSANYEERQQAMAPVFSALGVDVVLMGHDHSHARTYMMNGTVPDVVKNSDGSRPKEVKAKQGQTVYYTLNSSTGSKYYEQVNIGPEIAFNNQEEVPNMTKISVRKDRIVFTTCRVEDGASILEEFILVHQ